MSSQIARFSKGAARGREIVMSEVQVPEAFETVMMRHLARTYREANGYEEHCREEALMLPGEAAQRELEIEANGREDYYREALADTAIPEGWDDYEEPSF